MINSLRNAVRAVLDEVAIDYDATDAEGIEWYWISGEALAQLRAALAEEDNDE